mmetsp:Transcript_16376/g.33371  ORF Transcript_16376/g.33371 Transcript_16376/m.33371 type:complete len:383 (-) Transcript_16376:601-1749(-)
MAGVAGFVVGGVWSGSSARVGTGLVCDQRGLCIARGRLGSRVGRSVMMIAPVQQSASTARVIPITDKRVVVITGASSGIGLAAAKQLAKTGEWFVIMACRSLSKGIVAAKEERMSPDCYKVLHMDLAALESVRAFADILKRDNVTLSALVCNAAVWYPQDKRPRMTADGFEESVGTNHLGHFLLANLLLPLMTGNQPRMVFIGTETHNPDSIAGKIPPQARLGTLAGLESGLSGKYVMIDGGDFEPTKAYKDSKVCNAVTMREMHRRFHNKTGVAFSALFPGCIAASPLFRQKRGWFRFLFPLFQQYVTKQYVSVDEAGRRVKAVVSEPQYYVSGAYWKWNGQISESVPSVNTISREASDPKVADRVFSLSAKLVGLTNLTV